MRVFISWSGEPSQSIARALNHWLESVLPSVDPWMSDDEIGSGARWSDAIADSLDKTNFGIICITRANQHAPWLMFEAGALAKSVKTARAVPLCVDLPLSDVTGPLAQLQGRSLDKEGIRRLVRDLNQQTERPLGENRLDRVFARAWPDLESDIAVALKGVPGPPEPQRSVESMLAEVVDTMRRIERSAEIYGWAALDSATEASPSAYSEFVARKYFGEPRDIRPKDIRFAPEVLDRLGRYSQFRGETRLRAATRTLRHRNDH